MSMDAGDIVAHVRVDYDGSGFREAKADAEAFKTIAGDWSSGGQAISDALAALNDQFTGGTVVSEAFGKGIEALQKPLGSGGMAIAQLAESLQAGQGAFVDMGTAVEAIQEPLGTTVTMLQGAPEPIAQIAKNAESLQKPLAGINDSFTAMQDTLTQAVPLLPQYAESLNGGLEDFHQNYQVFQDALSDPAPYEMVQKYLYDTGQTWTDFTNAIGGDNARTLHQAFQDARNAASGPAYLSPDEIYDSSKAYQGAAENLNAFTAASADANAAAQAYGNGLIGPPEPDIASILTDPQYTTAGLVDRYQAQQAAARKQMLSDAAYGNGLIGPAEPDYAFTAPGEGGLNLGAMMGPMMAVQFATMAISGIVQGVTQFIQGVYQGATLAEGPIAHAGGTFTGTMDAIGQSIEFSNMRFSEGFGQQMIPLLSVANNLMSGSSGNNLGTIFGNFVNASLMSVLPAPFDQMLLQSEMSAQAPSPLSPAQRYTMTALSQMPQTVDMSAAQMNVQADQMLAEALSPAYLAAVQNQSVAQRVLSQAQLRYNSMNPPESAQMLLSDYSFASYATGQGYTPDQIAQMNADWRAMQSMPLPAPRVARGTAFDSTLYDFGGGGGATGGAGGGFDLGNFFGGIGSWLGNLFGGLGTGNWFSGLGGNLWDTLLYHSGWGSGSAPPGGSAGTAGGIGVGIGVQSSIGAQIADMVANIRLPKIDLSGIESSLASAFSGFSFQMPHIDFSSMLGWEQGISSQISSIFSNFMPQINFSGLESFGQNIGSQISGFLSNISSSMPHIDFSSMLDIGQGISNAFTSLTSNLHPPDFSGIISSVTGEFEKLTGIKVPPLPELANGVITWLGSLAGVQMPTLPNIAGQINAALSSMFSSISATLSMPGIPLYARGIQSAPPGLAVVGDAGPEILMMAGGESVYPMSSLGGGSFPSVFGDGGGNITLTINNITTLDGRVIAQATIPYIAPMARRASGVKR